VFAVMERAAARLSRADQETRAHARPRCRGRPMCGWASPSRAGGHAARADTLRRLPATVRHISAEPLLGPLDALDLTATYLVIARGESGAGRRPPQADWLRGRRDRCVAAGVAFTLRGWGGRSQAERGRLLDGREWRESPATYASDRPSRIVLSRARSFLLARRIAKAMRGAASVENPAGVPRFLITIRVSPSGVRSHV
jgi:hypothetical protein